MVINVKVKLQLNSTGISCNLIIIGFYFSSDYTGLYVQLL